jgi:hypothetical protein
MIYYVIGENVRDAQAYWYEQGEDFWKHKRAHFVTMPAHLRGLIVKNTDAVLTTPNATHNPHYAEIINELQRAKTRG